MNEKYILNRTEEFVRKTLEGDCTGHDFHHVERVRKIALYIAEKEGADRFIVELASLLHDCGDYKFHGGDEKKGLTVIRNFLEELSAEEKIVDRICEIIKNLSFKGGEVKSEPETLEGKIVQDADRLDAMGAIGIARTFAYGGWKGQEIYNPEIKPCRHRSFEEYKNRRTTTVNHFHEKLLLLKDFMNTETAGKMAEERHLFMEEFLRRFYLEWNAG